MATKSPRRLHARPRCMKRSAPRSIKRYLERAVRQQATGRRLLDELFDDRNEQQEEFIDFEIEDYISMFDYDEDRNQRYPYEDLLDDLHEDLQSDYERNLMWHDDYDPLDDPRFESHWDT